MKSYTTSTERFANKEDSPSAFLEQCIDAIAKRENDVKAFVDTDIDAARAQAQESTKRWEAGQQLSAIDGMPIGVKDIMETATMVTEQGSALFKNWRSGRDCAAVAALREAGAIVLGKTVTTEFASSHPGPTRNPLDLSRTPGGSSSGSAAAVASAMLPCALGSQVVGSTIRPASYCGTFGFKPSVGGLNRGGSFDGLSQSCTGVISASLDDAWLTAREISARVGGDPGYVGLTGPRTPPEPLPPRRIALLRTGGWGDATNEAKAALHRTVELLVNAGTEVVDADTDPLVNEVEVAVANALGLSLQITTWEGRWPLNTYARDMDINGLSASAQKRLATAEAMDQDDYAKLIAQRDHARRTYDRLRGQVDACVTLSASSAAPVGIETTGDPAFTAPTSLVGMPSISLPVLRDANLPLGLQVIGFTNQDARLFSTAAAILKLF